MTKKEEYNEQVRNRITKLDKLRDLGVHPYRNDFKPTATSQDVKSYYHWGPSGEHDKDGQPKMRCGRPPESTSPAAQFSLAGRIILLRSFGKAAFAKIRDSEGEIQVYVSKAEIGDEAFAAFKLCEVGDIIGVTGTGFLTKTKELTINANSAMLLTKAIRPLPEKWKGLRDVETRYRQRYLDLISNQDVRETFRKRSEVLRALRTFLDGHQFMEVETPMMHPLVTGAAARPFITHHNKLDRELYMRIAPELYLKRLVVGGFERVYEINRNFRNEGISIRHNPEFTMLEFYMAYATYEDLMSFTEQMIAYVAEEVCGATTVNYQGTDLDFSAPWRRMTMKEAIIEAWNEKNPDNPLAPSVLDETEALMSLLDEHYPAKGDEPAEHQKMEHGERISFLFEEVAEAGLIQPTFITQYPTAVSPLARKNEEDGTVTDRFEIFVYGRELGNAFSELNDPFDQRERFERQLEKKAEGANETMDYDEDYITALEHGMPPTAGEGIGVDRLCMFLCDAPSIRDVILFPLLKNAQ